MRSPQHVPLPDIRCELNTPRARIDGWPRILPVLDPVAGLLGAHFEAINRFDLDPW